MAEINLLSKETIDKIAAGEVVERPSSVVKELLENAVDAGAAAVTVEIKEGGISFIRVTDNGCGIPKDQVGKAFLRHATSKICSAEDLSHIASLGFRGEALSSIAAVSRLELITKTREELTGIRYLIEGGEEKEAEEVGAPEGTTILVRSLFFNTPVRRKFLKQPQTEGGYVSDLMEHMALSHPGIAFKYINNGQTRFHTSGNGNLQEIIYRIYGRDIASSLIPIDAEENGIRMQGFLGKPEINRANRNYEIYFVNGRFIKNSLISKALEEGYRSCLMHHKFPFAVLHFTIDARDIDVNVHPTKMEVRFTSQNRLFDFIVRKISLGLQSIELIPQVVLVKEVDAAEKSSSGSEIPEPFEVCRASQQAVSYGEAEAGVKASGILAEGGGYRTEAPAAKTRPLPVSAASCTETETASAAGQEEFLFLDSRTEKETLQEKEGPAVPSPVPVQPLMAEKPEQLSLFEDRLLTEGARGRYQILGQLFGTYWLIAFQDKLFIMDQHAAHEKVKYETLLRRLENRSLESQLLNPPIVLTLSAKEESAFLEYQSSLEELGFEIDAFGGNEYAVRGVPTDLYGRSGGEMFKEVLDELAEGPLRGTPEVIRQQLASMACKAAVKGNMNFDKPGIEALIDQLLSLEDPYHCPHGRPTVISMSKYEIEKKFKRIV